MRSGIPIRIVIIRLLCIVAFMTSLFYMLHHKEEMIVSWSQLTEREYCGEFIGVFRKNSPLGLGSPLGIKFSHGYVFDYSSQDDQVRKYFDQAKVDEEVIYCLDYFHVYHREIVQVYKNGTPIFLKSELIAKYERMRQANSLLFLLFFIVFIFSIVLRFKY